MAKKNSVLSGRRGDKSAGGCHPGSMVVNREVAPANRDWRPVQVLDRPTMAGMAGLRRVRLSTIPRIMLPGPRVGVQPGRSNSRTDVGPRSARPLQERAAMNGEWHWQPILLHAS